MSQLDKHIKEKFSNRTIEPSASAWERLSNQLDVEEKKKKRAWFVYVGYAASILLLVSIGIQLFSNDEEGIPKEIMVENSIDTIKIQKKIEQFINEVPIKEAIVKTDKVNDKIKSNIVAIPNSQKKQSVKNNEITSSKTPRNERIVIAQTIINDKAKDKKEIIKTSKIEEQIPNKNEQPKTIIKQNPNSRIKINSEDLLYAVTHSPEEVQSYYANNNTNREEVLKTIQNQLKESNFKIDTNLILAEVERTIDDESFENNFMKSLKKRVTNIANAIASRND